MAACNMHAAIIITLLAFLAPVACHGGGGALIIHFPVLCDGGWVRPINVILPVLGLTMVCPNGTRSETPLPLPSPSPNPSPSPSVPAPPSRLHPNYYNSTCPDAEATVSRVVEDAVRKEPRIGAGLIRLHFHDCFVRGCDASVLLTTTAKRNTDTELEAGPNKDSLRGMDVIEQAKYELEKKGGACPKPKTVSCADIVAFAARDAARILSDGNINYTAEGGRWDGLQSIASEANDALPSPFSNLVDLVAKFDLQGLNETDLVVLSGAHSIGKARCGFITNNNPSMNTTLPQGNNPECNGSPKPRVNQDNKTPDALDTKYYDNVEDGNALFGSDYALTDSPVTKTLVDKFKANPGKVWEKAYEVSAIKMGRINVKIKGDEGVEIREKCWTVNQ